jgi:site-specific recombinase XerD
MRATAANRENRVPKAVTPLARAIEDYLTDVDARTRNPRTRAFYEQGLVAVLLPFAREQGISEPGGLTTDLLNRLTVELGRRIGRHGKPLAGATIAAYMRAVRQFVSWLRKRKELSVDVEVARPRIPKAEIDVLSPAEVEGMISAATSVRDRALIQLLWETGCRLSEALALTHDDLIDEGRQGRFVRVRHRARAGGAKGDSARQVPIRPALYTALRRLGRRPDTLTDRIFVTDRRRAGEHVPLSSRQAEQALKVAAARAGIQKRVYPHLLRHSMATNWMRKRQDPVTLQRILGHSDLTMIARTYTHPANVDLYAAMMDYLR